MDNYFTLYACVDIKDNITTRIYDTTKCQFVNYNLEDIEPNHTLIYIVLPCGYSFLRDNYKNYESYVVKIFESNNNYKFMGNCSSKLVFVNHNFHCDTIYYLRSLKLYCATDNCDEREQPTHTIDAPTIIYEFRSISIGDVEIVAEKLYEITGGNYVVKKILPFLKIDNDDNLHVYNFYTVVKRENFTKCAKLQNYKNEIPNDNKNC